MTPPASKCEPVAFAALPPIPNLTQALVHSSQSEGIVEIPDWLFKTPSSFERDAPIMILLMGFLSWALVTVLFLGFTAPAVVALKLFGLSLAGMGVAWMIWMGWNYLHGSPR